MKTDKDIYPVEVFAGTPVQATFVKSLLENAEIEAYLRDEFSGTLYPWHSPLVELEPLKCSSPA